MTIMSPILNMFGRSPIRPLQQHIDKTHSAAEKLLPFFEAVITRDWNAAANYQQEIVSLEKEADSIKKDLRLHLPKGLFLPVPRADVLSVLDSQDRLANLARNIAGEVLGRQMHIPDEIAASYQLFLSRCIDASAQARKAINELDELLETGFRGNEVKLVEDMIRELDIIEQDTDEMQIAIRQKLFSIEKELPPIDAIFLYKMIVETGDLANFAQKVGGQLQLLLAR
jgi:predicted phosphate transport protein (TIGR00153 family)